MSGWTETDITRAEEWMVVSPRERAVPAQQSRLGIVGLKLWSHLYML